MRTHHRQLDSTQASIGQQFRRDNPQRVDHRRRQRLEMSTLGSGDDYGQEKEAEGEDLKHIQGAEEVGRGGSEFGRGALREFGLGAL